MRAGGAIIARLYAGGAVTKAAFHTVGTSPPSMSMVAPWSQRPRRDTMKATRPPMSSGVPKRVTLMSAPRRA